MFMNDDADYTYMLAALEEAKKAEGREEVPIGAVLVNPENGEIVARNGNRTRELNDPTAHAEILVIRDMCKNANSQRIPGYDLYVTLEPCTMCAAAISFARIRRLVYGAADQKGGGVDHGAQFYTQNTCHHKPEILEGVGAELCGDILTTFFQEMRQR